MMKEKPICYREYPDRCGSIPYKCLKCEAARGCFKEKYPEISKLNHLLLKKAYKDVTGSEMEY